MDLDRLFAALDALQRGVAMADDLRVIANDAPAMLRAKGPIGSRLTYSQRLALDAAGVPTTGEDGAPVSDGWRATWAAEELIRVRAEHAAAVTERNELRALQAEQQRAFVEGLRVATKTARQDGARAMRDCVADRILARSDALAKVDATASAGDLALAIEIGAIDYTTVAAEPAS